MKLIIAIIQDSDNEAVSGGLTSAGYRVTRTASTGGFLRRGNTTLLIGTEDERVDEAIQIIKDNCAPPPEPGHKRATVFVLNVNRYEQL